MPTGAIAFFEHFPKNFLRPYGLVETPPHPLETIKRRIQPYSCEWLTRPQVALSELAETLSKNTELLTNTTTPVVNKDWSDNYVDTLQPLIQPLEKFDRKANSKPSKTDVKSFLKFFWQQNKDLDTMIDHAVEIGAALFSTGIHLTVARTLMRNPEIYASKLSGTDETTRNFQRDKSPAALKKFLTTVCVKQSEKERPSLSTQSFMDALHSSADMTDAETQPPPKKNKKNKKQDKQVKK